MKKTILLVDDQREVLEGTKTFLQNAQIQELDIHLASDGRQGLMLAKQVRPDVIVTDIVMPEIDGLSMVSQLHQYGLKSRIIVLSAYSEFEYAKQAIQLGVSEYLVKPVTQRQIAGAVMRQLNSAYDAADHGMLLGLMLNNYLSGSDFYTRPADVWAVTGLSRFSDDCWRMIWLEPTGEDPAEQGLIRTKEVLQKNDVQGSVFRIPGGSLLALLHGSVPEEGIQALRNAMCREYRGGASAMGQGLESLPALYRQARFALECCREQGKAWHVENVSLGVNELIPEWELNELARAIDEADADQEDVWRCLDKLLARLTLADSDAVLKCASLEQAMTSLCERFGAMDCLPRFAYVGMRSLFEYKHQAMEIVRKLLERKDSPQSFAPIRRVQQYILIHYDSDCSVTYLANYADLSYSYFSAMFTRVMGVSASEYVLSVRLDAAEQMLRAQRDEQRKSIAEIAAKCGFDNPRYFSTCFKRRFGRSPSEYP